MVRKCHAEELRDVLARAPNQALTRVVKIVALHRCSAVRIWLADGDLRHDREGTLHLEDLMPVQDIGSDSSGFAPFGCAPPCRALSDR